MSLRLALGAMVRGNVEHVRAINRRYAHPRLAPSRTVRLALLALRIYIFVLIGLLGYKFISAIGQ
jgi:hypothetical protein